jgi:rubrerythrin
MNFKSFEGLIPFAIENEKALQLHNDLASKSEKSEWVKVFKRLSQEEAAHRLKLETLYDD